jgi:uncharacterized protein
MSILRFDEDALIALLERLPKRLFVGFAAACAERQLPNYFRFAEATGRGSPEQLTGALRCIWEDIEGQPKGSTELNIYLGICVSLLPNDEADEADDICLMGYYAEDAVSAVVYAIEARLKSDARAAAESAHVAYSALDVYVSEMLNIPSIGKNEEALILTHPLVQGEFERQQADVLQLQKIAGNPAREKEGLAEIRRRAQADAKIFFGL